MHAYPEGQALLSVLFIAPGPFRVHFALHPSYGMMLVHASESGNPENMRMLSLQTKIYIPELGCLKQRSQPPPVLPAAPRFVQLHQAPGTGLAQCLSRPCFPFAW